MKFYPYEKGGRQKKFLHSNTLYFEATVLCMLNGGGGGGGAGSEAQQVLG